MSQFDSTFQSLTLSTGKTIHYYGLSELQKLGFGDVDRFPIAMKILLESLVRCLLYTSPSPRD